MKLLNFRNNGETKLGVWTDSGILDFTELGLLFNKSVPKSMEEVLEEGKVPELHELLEKAYQSGKSLPYREEASLVFNPVVTKPGKIVCVGRNYLEHIKEGRSKEVPNEPILFSKFNNALAAHQEELSLPKEGRQFDYEGELVMVMGKEAKAVSKEAALSYVFGYTIGNDLSIRDLQFKSGQWLLGKTADKSAPVGPSIVTADAINPDNLGISTKRNGKLVQNSNTRYMIFNCATIVSYISRHMTLQPGDLIFTGTPEGVVLGYPEGEQEWLKPGDKLEVTIEQIGTLRNTII